MGRPRGVSLFTMLLLAVSAVNIGSVSAESCKPKHKFKTVENGVLTIAVTTLPPTSYMNDQGIAKGVDNDIATSFADIECLKVKPIAVDPAAAIQYVMAGKADIAVGSWYRTAARAKVMGLSAPLYLDQMAIISKSGASKISDFQGKKVGTVQGYLWVNELREIFGSNLNLYPNSVAALNDLRNGRIDAATDGYAPSSAAKQKGALENFEVKIAEPDKRVAATLEAAQNGFPFQKEAVDFGVALDAAIDVMHKDGTIGKILQQNGLESSIGDVGTPRLVK